MALLSAECIVSAENPVPYFVVIFEALMPAPSDTTLPISMAVPKVISSKASYEPLTYSTSPKRMPSPFP